MMVEGEGFEPSKAEPSDLQSDPFGHSGTPPQVMLFHLLAMVDVVFTLQITYKTYLRHRTLATMHFLFQTISKAK